MFPFIIILGRGGEQQNHQMTMISMYKSSSREEGNKVDMRLSRPPVLQRAMSSGQLDKVVKQPILRKALSFRDKSMIEIGGQEEVDALSDDDKIEIVVGEEETGYERAKFMQLEKTNKEELYDSFAVPEAEGFSLDFI